MFEDNERTKKNFLFSPIKFSLLNYTVMERPIDQEPVSRLVCIQHLVKTLLKFNINYDQ
jgi:hypothetical protein